MRRPQIMMTLGLSGILATLLSASGCESTHPKRTERAPAAPKDLRQSAVTYIKGLCTLPKEQLDPRVRELNEALLPNHATISCGRGGESN